jgi:hypothetical protein
MVQHIHFERTSKQAFDGKKIKPAMEGQSYFYVIVRNKGEQSVAICGKKL